VNRQSGIVLAPYEVGGNCQSGIVNAGDRLMGLRLYSNLSLKIYDPASRKESANQTIWGPTPDSPLTTHD
jgi:hypothetical protein